MKIAVSNLQSGMGVTKGYWQYMYRAWKKFLPATRRRIRQAAEFINEEKIDIAAFTEIDVGENPARNHVRELSERTLLKQNNFFPAYRKGVSVHQGNAIHSRFKMENFKNFRLPGRGEPRYMGKAEIKINGERICFFVTHLSLKKKIRKEQIRRIGEIIKGCNDKVMLAGDFNIRNEDEFVLLENTKLQKAVDAKTFPSWKPKKYFDHIFFSRNFKIKKSYVYDRVLFSDHLPLIVEVEF